MLKTGIINLLLVSFPEELLLLLMTLLVIGEKQFIKIRNKTNILKIIMIAGVTAVFTAVMHEKFEDFQAIIIIQLLFFVVTYIAVLKIEWYSVVTGLLLSLIFYMIAEFIGLNISSLITGVGYQELIEKYSNSAMLVLFSVPGRIIQISVVIFLYKASFTLINFGKIKNFAKNTVRRINILHIILIVMLILMTSFLNSYMKEGINNIVSFILSLVSMIALYILLLIYSVDTSKKIKKHKEEYELNLYWFKSLLAEKNNDIIAIREEIDKAINKIKES